MVAVGGSHSSGVEEARVPGTMLSHGMEYRAYPHPFLIIKETCFLGVFLNKTEWLNELSVWLPLCKLIGFEP